MNECSKRLILSVHAVDKIISRLTKHLNLCSTNNKFLVFL